MFTLTDTNQIACHGTSFKNLKEANDYALLLQEFNLCKTYSIGKYIDGKHIEVFNSLNGN